MLSTGYRANNYTYQFSHLFSPFVSLSFFSFFVQSNFSVISFFLVNLKCK